VQTRTPIVKRAHYPGYRSAVRCAGKQEPGSGGEHRDPGWLFRACGEEIRRSGDVPDHAGERITHSPVVTLCLPERDLASGNSNAATEPR
jgi:hypothetical protein